MGALTFDALLRSLKQGAPDPVYYLHGDEDVLKDEAIRALVERAVDPAARDFNVRSEEHTSELQSPCNLVCRLLLEKKKKQYVRDKKVVDQSKFQVIDLLTQY